MTHSLEAALRRCAVGPAARDGAGALHMDFVFPPGFIGFAGHFPDNPVLPGVVQTMAAALCATAGCSTRIIGLTRAKFLEPILPGVPVRVSCEAGQGGQAKARISVGDKTVATMTMTLEAEDAQG